jgi:hypothetical protein
MCRHQQKLWPLWLGNAILLIFLITLYAYTFGIVREDFKITNIFYAALFVLLAIEQVKNTRKARATLNDTKTVNS